MTSPRSAPRSNELTAGRPIVRSILAALFAIGFYACAGDDNAGQSSHPGTDASHAGTSGADGSGASAGSAGVSGSGGASADGSSPDGNAGSAATGGVAGTAGVDSGPDSDASTNICADPSIDP